MPLNLKKPSLISCPLKKRQAPFLSLLALLLTLLTGTAFGQPQTFTTIAGADFEAYKTTPAASPVWDDLVKEGFAAFDRQDNLTALEFLRKSINLGCRSPLVFFKMALAYESQGGYYPAIQSYEFAADGFKKMNQTHRYVGLLSENYGRALYMMGQTAKAIPILEEAARTQASPWVFKLLAQNALAAKDEAKTLSYDEAFATSPGAPTKPEEKEALYVEMARLADHIKDEAKAKTYYEQVVVINPANAEAKNYLKAQTPLNSPSNSTDQLMDFLKQHPIH